MIDLMRGLGSPAPTVFYVFFILISSFFVVNLFLAVIVEEFAHDSKESEEVRREA